MCICTYGEVLHLVGNLVEHLVLAHAVGVVVAAEADDNEAVFFAEDRLIDVPAGAEMGKDDGAHFSLSFSRRWRLSGVLGRWSMRGTFVGCG